MMDGDVHAGVVSSKKMDKRMETGAALESFVQVKDVGNMHTVEWRRDPTLLTHEFTRDEFPRGFPHLSSVNVANMTAAAANTHQNALMSSVSPIDCDMTSSKCFSATYTKQHVATKNAVQLLNELHPGVMYELVSETGKSHEKTFCMSATLNGTSYTGIGSSKRLARLTAAKRLLFALYNYTFMDMRLSAMVGEGMRLAVAPMPVVIATATLSQAVADAIDRMTHEKFESLMSNRPSHDRCKVLAGVLMSRRSTSQPLTADCFTLVALSTGTKCVNGEHMSLSGGVVNDCHAEVVVRRCLLDFLYGQLERLLATDTSASNIFERKPSASKYSLKEGVQFHLYINTAPCGDARIFSPRDAQTPADKHPNRKTRGQLRAKIESGEGTVPVKPSDSVQTWDGVLEGRRLLTMSCSDKIARWNVVGVQGALLGQLVEPVYLASMTVGSLFHVNHLVRAIYGRVQHTLAALPPPYRTCTPLLGASSSCDVRQSGKAPNYSVNWTIGNKCAEVINAITGKNEQGECSRLCKRLLFVRYRRLLCSLMPPDSLPASADVSSLLYGQCKRLNTDYMAAVRCLLSAFKQAQLGSWVKKPFEQDMFEVDADQVAGPCRYVDLPTPLPACRNGHHHSRALFNAF